jgi:hypothetical protein
MTSGTLVAISLRPTGNDQGRYYFMSLQSGRRINRTHWTEVPITHEVINRVHVLARRSKAFCDLTFTWHDGSSILDEDDDDPDSDSDCNPSRDDALSNHDSASDADSDFVSESDRDDDDEDAPVNPIDLPGAGVEDADHNVNDHNETIDGQPDEDASDHDSDNENDNNDNDIENNENNNDNSPPAVSDDEITPPTTQQEWAPTQSEECATTNHQSPKSQEYEDDVKSVFLRSVTGAHERRHVIIMNIPGALMQTDIDELIHVRLEGTMALMLEK